MSKSLELLSELQKVVFDEEIAGHVPHHLLIRIKNHMDAFLPQKDPRYEKIQMEAAENYEDEGSVHIEHEGKIIMIDGEEKGAWVEAYVWVSLEDGQ